eukprot:6212143-Pleurochrysis_carterae.AAC.2
MRESSAEVQSCVCSDSAGRLVAQTLGWPLTSSTVACEQRSSRCCAEQPESKRAADRRERGA